MRATRPLFRLDPGWLFIITGLVVCAAGVLLPAQADLRALGEQLTQLQAEEARAYQRLAAHADFIDQVERGEPAMIKRLAAAQLNVVPATDKPVMLAAADASPVTEWIDATVDLDIRPSPAAGLSTLSRWASGPSRLWLFGGGIMAVFIGLLISPDVPRRSAGARRSGPQTVAQAWRSGAVVAPGEPMLITTSARPDGPALQSAIRIADELDASPSIDIDDHALAQQVDTVDLEVEELQPTSRTVVEAEPDDAGRDHAAEVIVHAKEIALQIPDHDDGNLKLAEVEEAEADVANAGVEPDAGAVARHDQEGVSPAESSMLLGVSDPRDEDEPDTAAPTPVLVVTRNEPAGSRKRRKRSRDDEGQAAQQASTASIPSAVETDEEDRDADSASAIPFLRYRRDPDGEDDRQTGPGAQEPD